MVPNGNSEMIRASGSSVQAGRTVRFFRISNFEPGRPLASPSGLFHPARQAVPHQCAGPAFSAAIAVSLASTPQVSKISSAASPSLNCSRADARSAVKDPRVFFSTSLPAALRAAVMSATTAAG
jgi:hypothetical protein